MLTWVRLSVLARAAAIFPAIFRVRDEVRRKGPMFSSSSIAAKLSESRFRVRVRVFPGEGEFLWRKWKNFTGSWRMRRRGKREQRGRLEIWRRFLRETGSWVRIRYTHLNPIGLIVDKPPVLSPNCEQTSCWVIVLFLQSNEPNVLA